MTVVTPPPAPLDRSASVVNAYGWAGLYAAVLLAVPIAVGLTSAGPDWLPGVLAAAIAVGGYLVRPARSLVVIAMYLLFIDTIALVAGSGIKVVDELVIPIVGVITVLRERGRIAEAWSWPRETGVILIMVAAVSSSLLAGVPAGTWIPGLVLLVKGIGMFYIARLLPITPEDFAWAMRLVLGIGLVVLVLGAIELLAPQVFSSIGLRPSEERAGLPAVKSLFYHQQLFGWFCGLIALFLYAHHALLQRRWMLVLALAFSVGTILSARRRAILGVIAGLFGGLFVDVIAGRRDRLAQLRRWIPSTAGMLIISLAFLPALAGLYQLTIDRYGGEQPGPGSPTEPGVDPDDDEEAQGAPARIALYQASVTIARDHFPLGVGLGRFGSWMSRTEYSEVYEEYGLDGIFGLSRSNPQFITDTFWPQILGETGVLGTIGYVVFLAALAVSLGRLGLRSGIPPADRAVVLAAGMVLIQTLAESLASPVFNSPPQVYLIMLIIGAVVGWQAREPSIAAGDPPTDRPVAPGTAAA